MAKDFHKSKTTKIDRNEIQKQHPLTKKFVKIDTKTGRIIQENSPGKPFPSVENKTRKI